MYPTEQHAWVNVDRITEPLCGKTRKGHFRGVATVVTKLLNIVGPDIAVFGQKDAQQALVIKAMTEQLNLPVEIRLSPIVREADGLAWSSRNRYLSSGERRRAAGIRTALEVSGLEPGSVGAVMASANGNQVLDRPVGCVEHLSSFAALLRRIVPDRTH